jgi:hypothetical protein
MRYHTDMKRGSTIFLQTLVCLIGLAVLALCVFILPMGIMNPKAGMYRPILIGMYFPALPFFIGLYQVMRLLGYITNGSVFSKTSIKPLQIIKYCGIAISVLYALGMPYIFIVAQKDDAPGVVLLGLIFTFAPVLVTITAAVLENLLQNALAIKSENDLTV